MTITINSYDRQRKAGTWQYAKTYTQSTSTTPQALDIAADAHTLGMGTATGSGARNIYTLAAGVEGQEVTIFCLATGEANVALTQPSGRLPFDVSIIASGGGATEPDTAWASATGMYVFQAAGEMLTAKFMNEAWHVLTLKGATVATTT